MNRVYTRVEAPAVVPHPYGLFSVASPITPADTFWQMGVEWNSWACSQAKVTVGQCINAGHVDGAETKTFLDDCGALSKYKPFTPYFGVNRSGQSYDVGEAVVRKTLQDAEEYVVERHLWHEISTAVTPVAASAAIVALGKVEDELGIHYQGTGVIHMSRSTATLLSEILVRVGDHLETMIGTPVAVGAGYTDPAPAIYGTGALSIRRSAIDVLAAWDTSVNDELVLAERTYVAGWDCFATGALVSPPT
jgi:hypothetical protein